jgi:hypothetical protein
MRFSGLPHESGGTVDLIYTPASSRPYAIARDERRRVMSFARPDDVRRVNYARTVDGQLTEHAHDGLIVRYEYDDAGRLAQVRPYGCGSPHLSIHRSSPHTPITRLPIRMLHGLTLRRSQHDVPTHDR